MFQLEPAPRYHLARAPLRQALAQVRFPLLARLQSLEGMAPIQDRLRPTYPYMERKDIAEMSVQIGPTGPSDPEIGSSITWELTNDDGTLVSVGPGIATLSMGQEYGGVEWASELFRGMLEALDGELNLQRCDRLGVRYLNLFEAPPGDERAWARMFKPELVGWIGLDIVRESARIENSITQTTLSAEAVEALAAAPGTVQAVVRSGLVQAGSALPGIPPIVTDSEAFLLDVDIFVAMPQAFEVQPLVNQFTELHSQIDRFFLWSLTPEGARFFEMGEDE